MFTRFVMPAVMAAVVLAAGCVSGNAQPYNLRYGIATVSFTYAPFYVAEDQGFFKQEGVTLEGVQMQGTSPAASATMSGSLQFFVGLPQTAALAIAKGENLATFALVTKEYGSNIVVSKEIAQKDKLTHAMPIEERLEFMKGIKIAGWTPGGSSDMFIRFIAAKEGWNPNVDLTILPIGPSAPMLAAMENKRIDAFALSAPTSYQAVDRMGAFILYNGASGEWPPLKDEPYMCLIGNTDWLSAHPEAAAAVYRGLWRAMVFMRQQPDAAKALIRKRLSSFDDAAFEAGYKDAIHTFPETPKVGAPEAEKIKDFVEILNGRPLGVPASRLIDERVGALAAKTYSGR